MKFCAPADNTYERCKSRNERRLASFEAERWEDEMSALQLIVPMFLAIQFVLVLVALVSALLFAGPPAALPARQPSRRDNRRRQTGPRA